MHGTAFVRLPDEGNPYSIHFSSCIVVLFRGCTCSRDLGPLVQSFFLFPPPSSPTRLVLLSVPTDSPAAAFSHHEDRGTPQRTLRTRQLTNMLASAGLVTHGSQRLYPATPQHPSIQSTHATGSSTGCQEEGSRNFGQRSRSRG